ncbi:MAG: Gfo/Idh/MocA family oxidoreductase [Pseudomonadota bacterium]
MISRLSVACIGAGYFSQFHRDAWARIDGAQAIACCDPDADRAAATGLSPFTDLGSLLEAGPYDIIDIISPPETHLTTLQAALAARPRAIICQKPFCNSLTEAQTATALAEQAGIPLIIHENFRFQPWYRAMKSAMTRGELGDVLQLTFRLRPGDGQGPHAYLDRQPYFQQMERFLIHETAVHWIDTVRYLLGAPERVFADLRRLNPVIAGEDAGTILFAYPDGQRALFDGNRLLDHSAENTRCTMGEALVEGTAGSLTLSGDGAVRLRRFGEMIEEEILSASTHSGFGGDCVYHLQSHVVDALQGQTPFENLARDYLDVIRTEEAVYQSASNGTWIALDPSGEAV